MSLILIDILFLTLIGAACAVDIYERRIPDSISVTALITVICKRSIKIIKATVTGAAAAGSGIHNISPLLTDIADMAAGGALALIITIVPYALNKSLGAGDIKLLCVCGMYAGLSGCMSIIFVSFITCSLFALIIIAVRKRRIHTLPFAPFIFTGIICFLFSAYLT